MNYRKLTIRIAGLLLAATCLTGCLAGRYMTNYALRPAEHGNDFEGDRAKAAKRYPGIITWYDELHQAGVFKDTTIIGEGGYRLHAVYAPAKDAANAKGTAIVVHGYTDNHICFMNLGRMYRDDLNMNVLLPDLHYHGESEGEAIQMGWKDRLDVKRWAYVAHDIWGDDLMVVHGVSMGAATTMMLSGEPDLPEYIRGFIEDCGYTSVWDQFYKQLKEMHLPKVVLNSANAVTRRKYGWDFKEASSVAQLAKSDRPVFFIHGDGDDFVPTRFVYECYEAKTKGYKELWVVENTPDHAASYRDHPVEYTEHVRAFLEKL